MRNSWEGVCLGLLVSYGADGKFTQNFGSLENLLYCNDMYNIHH